MPNWSWGNKTLILNKRKGENVAFAYLVKFSLFLYFTFEFNFFFVPITYLQEVSGMGFHVTQPGSSIATSLINAEAKPKHVLLLEIKVSIDATCCTNIQIIFISSLNFSCCPWAGDAVLVNQNTSAICQTFWICRGNPFLTPFLHQSSKLHQERMTCRLFWKTR